jgi:hypothetical protein
MLFLCWVWLSSTFFTMNKEVRFLLHAVPVFFFVAAWTVGRLAANGGRGLLAAIVTLSLIAVGHASFEARASADPRGLLSWVPAEGACYGDDEMLRTIRRDFVERVEGSKQGTTVGIGELDGLCHLLEWELHRAYPLYSRRPEPSICGYGFRVDAEQFVARGLRDGELRWVLVLDPMAGPGATTARVVERMLMADAAYEGRTRFELPQVGYRGFLYRLRPAHRR